MQGELNDIAHLSRVPGGPAEHEHALDQRQQLGRDDIGGPSAIDLATALRGGHSVGDAAVQVGEDTPDGLGNVRVSGQELKLPESGGSAEQEGTGPGPIGAARLERAGRSGAERVLSLVSAGIESLAVTGEVEPPVLLEVPVRDDGSQWLGRFHLARHDGLMRRPPADADSGLG